jgi:GrpB-like predicted nucleotidyltransferase (UPF0157 family)
MVGLDRERVVLEPYDETWSTEFAPERDRLRSAVGDRIGRFEHVGSTAVAGMPAKPVVDVLGLVADLGTADALVTPLESLRYERRDDDMDRALFAKGPVENRTHYLHLAAAGSDYAREMLAFRDYLRANPDVAAEYADLKRELAERYPRDRDAYTDGKRAFVERAVDDALAGRE